MKKSSFKLYFITFVFTLTLASATFADGNVHCPEPTPPPPSSGGRMVVTGQEIIDANINLIKDLLSFLVKF